MASKSGSKKKSGSAYSGDAGDKDRLIAELKEQVAVLENELRLKQGDTASRESGDCEPMGDYQALFQRMVDKAGDMVFLLGPMGRIQYANKAACKTLSYTPEELQSMIVFDINQIHNMDNWLEHEEELKKQGSMTFENVFKTKDGRLIQVEISANFARLGDREYNYAFIRDITERKRMEEELRMSRDELEVRVRKRTAESSKSEAMLREIIETSPVPMVVYREEKNYYINKKFIDTFGYTKEDIPSVKEWWPLAYPDEEYREFVKNRWYAAVDKAVKEKASIAPQEVIVTCKDGSKKYVLADFSSIGDMNLAILHDITERKQAEDALRTSEARFRSYFEMPLLGILITSPEKGVIQVNEKFCALIGYSADELKETTWNKITHPEDLAQDVEQFNRILAGEIDSYTLEKRFTHKNGTLIPTILSVGCVRHPDHKVNYFIAVVQDIRERKQAEDALMDSEDKYRGIVEQSSDGILLVDEKGTILEMNWAEEVITGCKKADWIGKPLVDMLFYTMPHEKRTNEMRLQTEADVNEAYQTGFAPWLNRTMEIDIQRPDGARRTIQMVTFPIKTSRSTIFGSFIRDITDRKLTEEALEAAKAQAELYVDLMGHDINNMNQVSMGFLELAHNIIEMDGKLGEENIVLLNKAAESLKNSSKLIDNVRKLQRERRGQYEPEVIDVGIMVEDTVEQFQSIPGRNVKVTYNIADQCTVQANGLLKDVFINLIGNAVKHSRGDLAINVRVSRVSYNGNTYCQIDVEDDGPGIPDALKATLFDRLSLTTTRAKGKGFGLCLIKMLVDDYQGKFWVEDRIKGDHTQGARFVVMLPTVEK